MAGVVTFCWATTRGSALVAAEEASRQRFTGGANRAARSEIWPAEVLHCVEAAGTTLVRDIPMQLCGRHFSFGPLRPRRAVACCRQIPESANSSIPAEPPAERTISPPASWPIISSDLGQQVVVEDRGARAETSRAGDDHRRPTATPSCSMRPTMRSARRSTRSCRSTSSATPFPSPASCGSPMSW